MPRTLHPLPIQLKPRNIVVAEGDNLRCGELGLAGSLPDSPSVPPLRLPVPLLGPPLALLMVASVPPL